MTGARSHAVTVEPAGLVVEVREDETLMGAAARCGYRWPSVCGGHAECRACHVFVPAGDPNLRPPGPVEAESLAGARGYLGRPDVRLACQLRVLGPVTVRKRGWFPDGRGATASLPPSGRHEL